MSGDIWDFWQRSLAGESPDIDANTPQCGFYRIRDGRGGKWLPVMIRFDDAGKLRCRVGDNSNADAHDVWTWCAANPVSKSNARIAFETGSFPGEVELAGDNLGPASLSDQVRSYIEQALDWFGKIGNRISDDLQKDQAANYRNELLRLAKEADAEREREKRPHDEAAKAVQTKWKPVIDEAGDAAGQLRRELTRYMSEAEAKLEAERRAKYEAERRAAEVARAEVEAQRKKKLADDPIAALTDPDDLGLPELPAPPEPVRVQAGGQRGKATGLRTVTKYVVTDYEAALAHVKSHPDVRTAVEKVAAAQAKAGATVPGVEAKQEKVAA